MERQTATRRRSQEAWQSVRLDQVITPSATPAGARADQPQPQGMPGSGFVVGRRSRHRDARCVLGVAATVSGVLVIVIHCWARRECAREGVLQVLGGVAHGPRSAGHVRRASWRPARRADKTRWMPRSADSTATVAEKLFTARALYQPVHRSRPTPAPTPPPNRLSTLDMSCAPPSPDFQVSSYHARAAAQPAHLQQLPAYQAPALSSHQPQPQHPHLHPHPHPHQHQPHPPPQHILRPMLQSQPAPQPYMPRHLASEESMPDADYVPDASLPLTADAGSGLGGADMPNTDHITIKNHFPVARIKRIMQADDDVGKVAQVTPVVVCTFPFAHAGPRQCR